MSREKQIEEMANTYYEAMLKARGTLGSMNEGAPKWYAKAFYNAGYRKASEVAREIIADLEKIIEVDKYGEAKFDIRELHKLELKYTDRGAWNPFASAELKKKYTESEKDNG